MQQLEIKKEKLEDDDIIISIGQVDHWHGPITITNIPNGDIEYSFNETRKYAKLIVSSVSLLQSILDNAVHIGGTDYRISEDVINKIREVLK